MERTSFSSQDFEFLKFHWAIAIEKNIGFFAGTPWFSSEFFAKLRGNCSHTTIDENFRRLGLTPLEDQEQKPVKEGQYFFWNLLDLQKF